MSTLEKLHELRCKTLFSTHYHQLTEINLPRVRNYHLDIIENDDGSINFVRKLHPGSTDKSYGIHVAKLAGIPEDVIIRAFEILEQIEQKDPFKATIRENGNMISSRKYKDVLANKKSEELKKLNEEIELKTEKLTECDERLNQKEADLNKLKLELEETKAKMELLKDKKHVDKKPEISTSTKKELIQTTFFKPVVRKEKVLDESFKQLLDFLNVIDPNTITPLEAMKKLIELKELLNDLKV
jgi:DNA mismatch repair protein MutS